MPGHYLLRRALVLVGMVTAILAAAPAWALGAADAFTVRGIEVDVTAGTAQAAKDQAILEGQRDAFRILLERLTAPADHARLPKADGAQYVRDFSVDQERSSSVRYIATLTVRFQPAAVRKLLRDANISYAEARSRGVVIVPVYQVQGHVLLWEDVNPWRAAWNSLGGGGLVPLFVPPGDATDAQLLGPEQAAAGDAQALQALSARYGGADVLVPVAGLAPGGRQLDVVVAGTPDAPKPFDAVSYQLGENETLEHMLTRAARDVQRAIDAVHKQPNLLQFDRAATISALVPLAGIEDWLMVRDNLGRVSQVRKWELVSLSKAEAAVVLHIVGDQEQVKGALARQGLALEWGPGYWVMKPVKR
ncbi:MAG: DUF2066 domain-containing protein [Solirubrobacterales bacterium]